MASFSSESLRARLPTKRISFTVIFACSLIWKITFTSLLGSGTILGVTSARKKPFSTYFSCIFFADLRTASWSRIWNGFTSMVSLKSSFESSSLPSSFTSRTAGFSLTSTVSTYPVRGGFAALTSILTSLK